MQKVTHQTYSFAGFTLDLTRGCLRGGQQEIKLRPKSFEVLKFLVENNKRLISKDEVVHAVWRDTAVTDDSLAQCLRDIRRALRDETQQIVKTVHGRGYILDKEVRKNATAELKRLSENTEGVQSVIEKSETNDLAIMETSTLPAVRNVDLISPHTATTSVIKHQRSIVVSGLAVLVIVMAVIVYFTRPGEAIDSIAVIPFVNVAGDPDTEYLSDRVTDSIIDNLSQLSNLTVISQSSTFPYKGQPIDPKRIGQELGVRALLMGRLVQRGEDLWVSAELVDARDNRRLWAHQYTRKVSDILAMQEDISLEISEKLRVKLSPEERKQLAKRYTENVKAYQAFLQGYHLLLEGNAGLAEKSIGYFQDAIRIDSNYAPAYAALARAYYKGENFAELPEESRRKIESALRKAEELDDSLADVHALLGAIRQDQGDWPEAEKEFKRAVELNPNGKGVHWYYARYLSAIGRDNEAIAEAKRGLEIDPLSPLRVTIVAVYYLNARQYDPAIELCRKALEMAPNYAWAHSNLGRAYVQKGMYKEAIAELQMPSAFNTQQRTRLDATLAYAFAASGNKAEANKILDELYERAKQSYVEPVNFAIIYAGLGETDRAFELLDKIYRDRPGPPYVQIDFMFDGLRSDPRFADFARRKGLAL